LNNVFELYHCNKAVVAVGVCSRKFIKEPQVCCVPHLLYARFL